MDREKRRSKEEEEELDRKIALIREKNQKIEQRSKEVEADRASNTVLSPKKPSASSQGQPVKGGKSKVWDREWDQGKTPANQWRENVPSIEHSGRLANAAGQNRRRGQHGQGSPNETIEKVNKGRLEGRVTIDPEKAAGNKNRGGRREGQQRNNSKNRDSNLDNQEKTNGAPRQEQRNRRRGDSEKKAVENKESGNVPKEEKNETPKKSRPRRENDRYAVRMVLKQLVEKIDKIERRRKRDEQRHEHESVVGEQKTESQLPSSEDLEKKENVKADANQNVIQLTRERVLTVQST